MIKMVEQVSPSLRDKWQQTPITTSKAGKIAVEFDVAEAAMMLPTRKVVLTLRTAAETSAARLRYVRGNGRLKFIFKAYREYIWRTYGKAPIEALDQQWDHMEVHHIKPLSLGGGNGWKNLAVLHPAVHRAVHDVIGIQARGIRPGESRVVFIPGPPEANDQPKVWLYHMGAPKRPENELANAPGKVVTLVR